MSLGEPLMRPTAMLFRNLASIDVEESIRVNPLDGVVLLMRCDKTIPALLMGAASIELPTIGVSRGPMLRGSYRGKLLGSGTNLFSMTEDLRAGVIGLEECHEAEACMHRSHGHGMVMGTASTMAAMVEALVCPAMPRFRPSMREGTNWRGRLELVREDICMSATLTYSTFQNAVVTLSAIGGSTNAIVHLLAIAGRLGVPLTLDDFDRLGSDVDCLVNLMPVDCSP